MRAGGLMRLKLISLLPTEYKKSKKTNRRTELAMVILGVILLVTIFSYGIVKIMATIPEEELRTLKIENDNIIKDIEALAYLEELETNVQKESSLAQGIVQNQPDWVVLFAAIGSSVPEGLQISQISTANEEKSVRFAIRGSASTYDAIALWLEKMKEVQEISEAVLTNAQSSPGNEKNTVSFQMIVTVFKDRPFKLFEEAKE
jgi:Tfp pilus assembly protein PilN